MHKNEFLPKTDYVTSDGFIETAPISAQIQSKLNKLTGR